MEHATVDHALSQVGSPPVHSFSIWGLAADIPTPKNVAVSPKLLFKYPPTADLPEHLAEFLVPFPTQTQAVTAKTYHHRHLPYFQLLHTRSESLFCTCLPHAELVGFPSDVLGETEIHKIYTTTASNAITTRVYCLATTGCFLSETVPLLQKLVADDFLFKDRWLDMYFFKTTPVERTFRYLTNNAVALKRVERLFRDVSCSTTPVSTPAAFDVPTSPRGDHILQQMHSVRLYCYPRLLATINAHAFLSLFTNIALGKGAIVVAKEPHLTSVACFALLALLHPLRWQGLFIPVVPPQLSDFLESPLPAILGSTTSTKDLVVLANVVSLDKSRRAKRTPADTTPPTFLAFDEVVLGISSLVQTYLADVCQAKSPAERDALVAAMDPNTLNIFVSSVQHLLDENVFHKPLDGIRAQMVSAHNVPLDTFIDAVLADPATKPFEREFVQTQHFNVWWYEHQHPRSAGDTPAT